MKTILPFLLIIILSSGCSADEIIDKAKEAFGIEDKFNAEINGDKWSAEVRTVKKLNSPIDNFTIVGTSLNGKVLQITVGGIKKGKYSASLADVISNLSLKMFVATYTPKVSQVTAADNILKVTSGTVEITEIGVKDDKNYISGTFNMKIVKESGNIIIKNGVFKELSYTENTTE